MSSVKKRLLRIEELEDRRLLAVISVDPVGFIGDDGSVTNDGDVIVTTLLDVVNPEDEQISLREAIELAGTAGFGSQIRFDASLAGGTILLSDAELVINKTLTIDASSLMNSGAETTGITIDARQQSRVLKVTGGSTEAPVVLVGLTLKNGSIADNGGGLYHSGVLSLFRCVISGNSSTASSGRGGGIYNVGALSLYDCVVTANASSGSVGGGGGIHNAGTLTLTNSTVAGNTAAWSCGGLLSSGSVILRNTIVSHNWNDDFRGSLSSQSGNNMIGADAGFVVTPEFDSGGKLSNAELMNLRLSQGSWGIDRGNNGFVPDKDRDVTGGDRILRSWQTSAITDIGAFEYRQTFDKKVETLISVVTTTADVINDTDNRVSLREALLYAREGGTITFAPTLAGRTILLDGVSLYVYKSVTIDASNLAAGVTVSGDGCCGVINIASELLSVQVELNRLALINGYEGYGGAVYNCNGALLMTNCIVTGNRAFYNGGGVYNYMGTLTMNGCTVACNRVLEGSNSGGGIANYGNVSYVTLKNTIVAQNQSSSADNDIVVYSGAISGSRVLSSYTFWTVADQNYVYHPSKPLFSDTAGGDFSLCADSQALDLGNNEDVFYPNGTAIETDFSGVARISNKTVDLGAYEYQVTYEMLDTPSNVRLSLNGDNVIVKSDPVPNADRYVIQYSEFVSFDVFRSAEGSDPRFILTDFEAGETYYFRIRAEDSTETFIASDFSEPLSLLWTRLAAPQNIRTEISGSDVALFFDTSPHANNYVVYYSTDSSFSLYQYVTTQTGSAVVSGLSKNTPYYFHIQARDTSGDYSNSSFSPTVSVTLIDQTEQLDIPTGLAAASAGANRTLVTWNEVDNAAGYTLSYSTDWINWTETSTPETSFTVTGQTYGSKFIYRVRANGDALLFRDSDFSDTVPLTVSPSDIDGDGYVGPSDRTLLSSAWLSGASKPSWNPRCDIDGDGIIGPSDRNFLSRNWLLTVSSNKMTYPLAKTDAIKETGLSVDTMLESFVPHPHTDAGIVNAPVLTMILSAPTNVRVSPSGTTALVTFDGPEQANYSVVYYSTDITFASYQYVTTETESATATNLTMGVTYFFRVQARDTTGTYKTSDYSETVSAISTQLAAPQDLQVNMEGGTATALFTLSDHADFYILYYSTDPDFNHYDYVSLTENSAVIGDLLLGTTYYFRVQAFDTSGTYDTSDVSETVYASSNKLSAPTNLTVKTDGTKADVTFDGSANADLYTICYTTDPTFSVYDYFNTTTVGATIQNITMGVRYYYRVQAHDTTGSYTDSNYSVVTEASSFALGAPENLQVTIVGTEANLTFDDSANADRYIIYYTEDPTFAAYRYTVSTSASAVVTNLTMGTTYYFRVQARDTTGKYANSGYSETVSAYSMQLAVPKNFQVTTLGCAATATFDASENANHYIIYYSTNSSFAEYRYVSITETKAVLSDLEEYTTYYFKVQARDTTGYYISSDMSPLVSATTTSTTPPLPTPIDVSAASAGCNRTTVNWGKVENAVSYTLAYSVDQAQWTEATTAANTFTVGDLVYGTRVYYKVKAQGDGIAFTDSEYSAAISLSVCPSDINGDGRIGPADMSFLSSAWFSKTSGAKWDSRCDIDANGVVGPTDRNYLSANWLKSASSRNLINPPAQADQFTLLEANDFDFVLENVPEDDDIFSTPDAELNFIFDPF